MFKTHSSSPSLKDHTFLVTGATGFIGQHLIRALRARGARVMGSSRKAQGEFIGLDVSQSEDVAQAFEVCQEKFDKPLEYILHLGGEKSAGVAREYPAETLKAGFLGALNLLEEARKQECLKKMVLISSLAVYEQSQSDEALEEKNALRADSTYAAGKMVNEVLASAYFHEFELPVVTARLSNVYGPGQSSVAVIPSILEQLKLGIDISIGNSQAIRDFIYVEDVVEGLIALCLSNETSGKVFNLSTGIGTSIAQVTETLSRIVDFKGKLLIDPKKVRLHEKSTIVARSRLLTELTGWVPQTKLEDGLRKMASSYSR